MAHFILKSFLRSLFLAVLVLVPTSTMLGQFNDKITWYDDLEAAKTAAAKENKVVLLHFWATWCRPCTNLDKFVFSNPSVKSALNEKVIAVKVNVDVRSDLAKQFSIQSIPADVVITPAGYEIAKRSSPQTADGYVMMLKGLDQLNSTANSQLTRAMKDSQAAAAKEIRDSANAADRAMAQKIKDGQAQYNQLNEGLVNGSMSSSSGQLGSGQFTGGGGQFGGGQFRAGADTNQASLEGALERAVANSKSELNARLQETNSSANDAVSGTTKKITNKFTNQTNSFDQTIADFRAKINEQKDELKQQIANQGFGSQASQANTTAVKTIAEKTKTTKMGIEGYCPVTLINQEKWQKGDKKWGCIHRGKTYHFATEEDRDLFRMAPDAYSPLLAGYDPVVYAEKGNLVPGIRSNGAFYGGNNGPKIIVLFADQATRTKFESDPSRYIQTVREAMVQTDDKKIMR